MIIPALRPVLSRVLLMPILLGYGSMSSIAIAKIYLSVDTSKHSQEIIEDLKILK